MKTFNLTKKLQAAVIGIAFLGSGLIYAQIQHEAENCRYTGNSADYCYTSNGQQNLKVINCRPCTTSCYY